MTDDPASDRSDAADRPGWRLLIHGGAGVLERGRIGADEDRAVRQSLTAALDAGAAILAGGGSALDAVEASARALEDDPHFNAGRGSVFTYQGTIELDAAIMDGRDRAAGAVSGVTATRNPISLARAVMEKIAARAAEPRGRRRIFAPAGPRPGAARIFPDARAPPPARRAAPPRRRLFRHRRQIWHDRRRRARQRRPRRRRDLDRRPHRQEMGADRRFADHRRRHLCRRPGGRGLGHRRRRIFPARRRRPRNLRADPLHVRADRPGQALRANRSRRSPMR